MADQDRFHWAVKLLDVQSRDEILEIGCGTGIAIEQVADALEGGSVTGLDRSQSQVDKAEKRNAHHIEAGKVTLLAEALADADLPTGRFTKVFAFNVSLFWDRGRASKELQAVRRVLAPNGRLYVFHQPPVEKTEEVLDRTMHTLEDEGFEVVETHLAPMRPASASCVVAVVDASAG